MWRHLSQTGSGCFLCQVLKLVLVKTDTPTHTPLLFLLFILFLFLDSLNTNLLIIKETHQKSSKCSSCRPQKCNSCLWRIHLMNALEIKWQTGAKKKKVWWDGWRMDDDWPTLKTPATTGAVCLPNRCKQWLMLPERRYYQSQITKSTASLFLENSSSRVPTFAFRLKF